MYCNFLIEVILCIIILCTFVIFMWGFHINCCLISTHKIIKMHKDILNDVIYGIIIFTCSSQYTNALKNVLLMLVYLSFLSLVTSFLHIKSLKCTKLFWMISYTHLYYNRCVFKLLWSLRQKTPFAAHHLQRFSVKNRSKWVYSGC
jgi:hypothetical protein